jgi:hypothetical protein
MWLTAGARQVGTATALLLVLAAPHAAGGAGDKCTPRNAHPVPVLWQVQGDVVVDPDTCLMWTRGDFRTLKGRFAKNWQEAMAWAKEMNAASYAGHGDWRVASIAEYRTISNYAFRKTFLSDGEDHYWARNEINRYVASYYDFNDGGGSSTSKIPGKYGVREPSGWRLANSSARLVRRLP